MKRTSLPGMATLSCFACAAKHQSYTDAALELGMTQSAVSKKIRELEQYLGVPLFQRVGRGVVLTPAGKTFPATFPEISISLKTRCKRRFPPVSESPRYPLRRCPRLPTFGRSHDCQSFRLCTRVFRSTSPRGWSRLSLIASPLI